MHACWLVYDVEWVQTVLSPGIPNKMYSGTHAKGKLFRHKNTDAFKKWAFWQAYAFDKWNNYILKNKHCTLVLKHKLLSYLGKYYTPFCLDLLARLVFFVMTKIRGITITTAFALLLSPSSSGKIFNVDHYF